MLYPNVETFIGCDSSYRAASIVLYGAPYDSTTSYRPGARFGPAAIRHESYGLETYSPYQNADLTDFVAEGMRAYSMRFTNRAMLSRAVCMQRGKTLVINFPGSEKAVRENWEAVNEVLEHALAMMDGQGH